MSRQPPLLMDPQLLLPVPPYPLPRLATPGGRIESAGEAGDDLFFLAGRRTLIWGTESGGVQEVRFHPFRALLKLDAGLGPARQVRVTPGSLQRELNGSSGLLLERVLTFRELPAAAVQWSTPTEAEAPIALEISFEVGPFLPPERGGAPLLYRYHENRLRISVDSDGAGVLYFLSHTPEEWEVIQSELRENYDRILRLIDGAPAWNAPEIGGAIGVVAHTAYHLGEIQQALCVIKG